MDWIFRSAPCGLVVLASDGTVLQSNDRFRAWVGRDAIGEDFTGVLDPPSQLYFQTRCLPVLQLGGEAHGALLSLQTPGGTLATLVEAGVSAQGESPSIVIAMFDATERREYEQRLLAAQRERERLDRQVRVLQAASGVLAVADTERALGSALIDIAQEAFDASSAGVFLQDDAGEFQLLAGVNPLAEGMRGRPSPGLGRQSLDEGRVIVISDLDEIEALAPGLTGVFHAAGVEAMSVSPILDEDHAIGVLACFFGRPRTFDDQTVALQEALTRQAAKVLLRIRLQDRVRSIAMHDPLTRLPNRALFEERLNELAARTAYEGSSLAVLFLDLDGFKSVNDGNGHDVGDRLLREVAARLRATVREDDVIGRSGGDEFMVACIRADENVAVAVADRLREAIAVPFDWLGDDYRVTASIGVAVIGRESGAPPIARLVRVADQAMYAAKDAGRNQVSVIRL